MKVIISGASGLVGRWLVPDLTANGHQVVQLVRNRTGTIPGTSACWRPDRGELDPSLLAGADAVVNLNGRSIGDGRWSKTVRTELWSSRIDSTHTLVTAIRQASPPPKLLVNASAIGFYGDRGELELDESAQRGEGFLAELAEAWEDTAFAARAGGTRVAALRFGMIIGRGGALDRMLPIFRVGLGGPLGKGRQWWSWVAMEDVLGTIREVLENPAAEGPINVVAPTATRCRDFTAELGAILHRPALLPAPGFALRLALGEMADALLLASTRVVPAGLERLGYRHHVPQLDAALRKALD